MVATFQVIPKCRADGLLGRPLVRLPLRPDGGLLDDVVQDSPRGHGLLRCIPLDEYQVVQDW